MVTAELAACLPVLVLVLAVAVSAVSVVATRVRVQDAAREAARAAARGDPAAARQLAARVAPGARLELSTDGLAGNSQDVIAVVEQHVAPLGGWLPSVTVSEQAVAAVEPRSSSP
jgi:Flp pilus assembly protein TadG